MPRRSSIPNFTQVNAQGDTGAIFPGGVQILAGDLNTPRNERQVRWVRESDGALVAQIFASNYPDGSIANITAHGFQPTDFVEVSQVVADEANVAHGQLSVTRDPQADADTRVYAMTTKEGTGFFTEQETIIVDSKGRSSFPRMVAAQDPMNVRTLFMGIVGVPALAPQTAANSAVIGTGMFTPDASGLTFNFMRIAGAFAALGGSPLGWGYVTSVVGGEVSVQFQFRNLAAAGNTAALSFTPTIYVGFA